MQTAESKGELTDNQMARLSSAVRTLTFLEDNMDKLSGNENIPKLTAELKIIIGRIFNNLTDEDRDAVLERYKREMQKLGLKK